MAKHRELTAELETNIETLGAEREKQAGALREGHAAFDNEFAKRSKEEYFKLNEAYHRAKRKLLPQYPTLRGFVDSADGGAAAQKASAGGGGAAQ